MRTLTMISNELLGVLHEFAPTGKEQRFCTEIYWTYEKAQHGSGLLFLANALHDGLAYGTWPWDNLRTPEVLANRD